MTDPVPDREAIALADELDAFRRSQRGDTPQMALAILKLDKASAALRSLPTREAVKVLEFVASDPCFHLLGTVTQDEVHAVLTAQPRLEQKP